MLHRIFFGGDKYPESANKYTKFDQLIIRKIIKILPPDVTLKAEMDQIRVLASVRLLLSVCALDGEATMVAFNGRKVGG